MPVPSTVADLSATASSNYPAGSDAIGTTLDDYLRSHAAIIRQVSDAKVSAGTATSSGLTVSATDKVLGRLSSGSGAIEEITCTAAGRALLDDADAAAQRTTLGLVIGTNVQAYDAGIPTVAASQAEMEAGTETALRSMSPLRVAQAIAALAKNPVLDTAKASTSGTYIDFTGIPSWVKRITVMFDGVSTNGSSVVQVQLGAGSADATGYSAMCADGTSAGFYNNITTGFPLGTSTVSGAAYTIQGSLVFTLLGSNTWTGSGNTFNTGASVYVLSIAGVKTTSGTLDRVRITTVNGTDTFDAGTINIMYE